MASFESSYKSQLMGVTQQVARERLDGQVSAQENMLSDPVTNTRRRPGAQYAYSMQLVGGDEDSVMAWDTDLAGTRVQLILNLRSGTITVLDALYNKLATLTDPYLMSPWATTIQTAVVGGEFFVLNTLSAPALGPVFAGPNPKLTGFAYVRAGAFSKTYDLRVVTWRNSVTYSYTTPDGTHVGDANISTAVYIMGQLVNQVNAGTVATGVSGEQEGAEARFTGESTAIEMTLSSGSGTGYLVTSGKSYLAQESDLPIRLPSTANGYIVSVGTQKALRYYQYSSVSASWLECGQFGSPSSILGCPISITNKSGVWALNKTNFEGRFAGDDTSNPAPDFVANGITGMATYQGRLVLLAGTMVNLSASNNPRRFWRSTVTSLLDSDPISIGASAATAAQYKYAVPFAKDLLLFSEGYQALIPGGTTAITPRNASVVVTSSYTQDLTSSPVRVGQSLMYPVPRSKDFFGMMEVLPSSTVQNQYDSTDSTAHLPKYMAGRCRGGVANSGSNMVLFMPSNDRRALIVQEYQWQNGAKVQQAWHKWTFPYNVAWAYFSKQIVHVMFVQNGYLVTCTIDPRAGSSNAAGDKLAFLDLCSFKDVVAGKVDTSAWIQQFDPTAWGRVRLAVASGPMAGEPVGCTVSGQSLLTVRSFQNGRVAAGIPYTSLISPTQPMRKDYQGVVITSDKLTLLRFMVSTNKSANYKVSVDDASQDPTVSEAGTLFYSSQELDLGRARNGADSTAIIPCRTNAANTTLILSTSGMGELNVVGIEYVARSHDKIKRR